MARNEWFKKLDLSRFTPRERWLIILTAITLAVLLLLYIYLPLHRQASSLFEEHEKLKREVIGLEEQVDEGRKTTELLKMSTPPPAVPALGGSDSPPQAERDLLGSPASGGDEQGPRPQKIPLILDELNRLAKAAAVDLLSVRPQAIPESSQDSGAFKAQSILIDVRSTFQGVGRFLKMLENLPRLMNLQNIKIEADPAEATKVFVHLYLTVYLEKS
ncbi:MAG: type 4a pilus biogenesis protein PilO [Nitrospiria bacterium]